MDKTEQKSYNCSLPHYSMSDLVTLRDNLDFSDIVYKIGAEVRMNEETYELT